MQSFHPAVSTWFEKTFTAPTGAQQEAWPAIQSGQTTLVAAPTGSGKTLAAFLAAIDELVRLGLQGDLQNQTYVIYVSPLKALSNDIEKNLQMPLQGIAASLAALGLPPVEIRTWVRSGDTPPGERQKMRKLPPHILVTTPESLFILLTSESGRVMLQHTRTVIIDEIHALAGNKRGAHLALSLQRLHALTKKPLLRIGLSATQKPIDRIAAFLTGRDNAPCKIIDNGYSRRRDLALEVPLSPLEAVMSNEVWQELYQRLSELITQHRTTLIFVNTRRLAERAARFLAERIGADKVAAHHGSLAREHRLAAEQKLKRGELQAMVATASLELGIDIGEIDLVCQIGTPRGIATFLQRIGRSGHSVGGLPKGRLFPLSRDDLLECCALLDAVQQGELDTIKIPNAPLDVLAQHIIAEVGAREWQQDELYACVQCAYPYRTLSKDTFQQIIDMLAQGFSTRRGQRSAYLHYDAVHRMLRARKGARLSAITNAGTIPDQFDYEVLLQPHNQFIGTLNEDFAFESLPGDIFQLGNTSYRILKIEQGKVRVEDAHGQPPNIPFWFGEAPGRSDELSLAVSRLRGEIEQQLRNGIDNTTEWLVKEKNIAGQAAVQLVEYLAATQAALKAIPTQDILIFERFFDEAGDQHLVIHSPYGSRLNRAWGLALRKRFCRKFNFELQAAALEDSIVLSLGATHSFPLQEVAHYLHSISVRDVLIQAMLDAPMFLTHWRWNACVALAIKRNRNGKRTPAQFQRMDAEDLMAVIFPDQLACQENIAGRREIPNHPLVQQTINDCLHQLMDINGLENVLRKIESKEITILCRDLGGPSPLAQEILHARPYAFLDDAPAEERRTHAVLARRFSEPQAAAELGRLNPEAIQQVREEAWPSIANIDELHDALLVLGFMRAEEAQTYPAAWFTRLSETKRATCLQSESRSFWVCAERLPAMQILYPHAILQPIIIAAGAWVQQNWTFDIALVEILRGRLQALGPCHAAVLSKTLDLPANKITNALHNLEQEGYIMRGCFTHEATHHTSQEEWCERALLARIHRYTLQQLRQAVQPVSPADFMRFLFAWQRLNEKPTATTQSLQNSLTQLEGYPIAASAWETDILPARLSSYTSNELDQLCLSGRILWQRLSPGEYKSGAPLRNTPIVLLSRVHCHHWQALHHTAAITMLSNNARVCWQHLKQQGASFFADLLHGTGLLRSQVENALGELVANGFVNADAYSGLRALVMPSQSRAGGARRSRLQSTCSNIEQAGRWSLLPQNVVQEKTTGTWLKTQTETLEYIASILLRRYGVVFRKILERENNLPPWRELLYCYRRLEARGEIRGGRFVDGFAGEQFALPDAVGLLREQHKHADDQKLIALSAVDPLNLSGIITNGTRVAAIPSNRILYKDGIPIALHINGETEFLQTLDPELAWQAQNKLLQQHKAAQYLRGSTRLS